MRYIIIPESLSAHCCFEYTIVDTKAGKKDLGGTDYWNKSMCECFDEEEAVEICNALNKEDGVKE